MSRRCGFPPFGATPSLRKSTVFYHKVTAILILFQLAIAICDFFKIDYFRLLVYNLSYENRKY